MTSRDFCYGLQGAFELDAAGDAQPDESKGLSAEKVKVVRAHLAMVFKHEVDPSMGSKEHQAALDKLHESFPGISREVFAGERAKWRN